MNIYLFELRRAWKSAVIWAVVLLAFLFVMAVTVYPMFTDSRSAVETALEGFPPEFSAAFGIYLNDIFSFGGFYSFCYLYICIMGAIMASSLGLDVFSREKRSKSTDFLMTKPVSRRKIFIMKLLVPFTLILAMNIIYTVTMVVLCGSTGQDISAANAALAGSALFFTQLVILAIAATAAVLFKKVRSVTGGAMAISIGAFILTALYNILEDESMRFIAIFKYFDVYTAFNEGRFETPYVIIAAVIFIALLSVSFVKYCRSEIHSV